MESESTRETIKRLYPKDSGETIALPAEAMAWADEYHELRRRKKDVEEAIDLYDNKIKLAIGDASGGLLPDGSGFSYKLQQRKEYTVAASEYRVLRAVKAKK